MASADRNIAGEIATRSDCSRCAALCCIAFPAESGEGFAASKEAGEPCPRLGPFGQCTIYWRRAEEGFAGCVGFECFGAGQYVTARHGGSNDWQADAGRLARMTAHFLAIHRAFELLWLSRHAQEISGSLAARSDAAALEKELVAIISRPADQLEARDLPEIERRLRSLLKGSAQQSRS